MCISCHRPILILKSFSTDPNDILNMIENLPSEIKDQIKTLTLEARAKRIIKILHDFLKKHLPGHEDHWEMPNPLIGYDDPQYHNHDPDEDADEEWFHGRDGWD